MSTTKTLNKADLNQFTGSEHWYRHPLSAKITYTDGAQYVAQAGGAYWLLDIIVSVQHEKSVAAKRLQVWKLKVQDKRGVVTCEDGNGNTVYRQEIEYTDFPLDSIDFYFTDNVIHLPSEY